MTAGQGRGAASLFPLPPGVKVRGAARPRHDLRFGVFTVKTQIPLYPPLPKGDFKTPSLKRGAGGIFIFGGELFEIHGRLASRGVATRVRKIGLLSSHWQELIMGAFILLTCG
jgi:hypothetical protein